jgi:hypothetical protein
MANPAGERAFSNSDLGNNEVISIAGNITITQNNL